MSKYTEEEIEYLREFYCKQDRPTILKDLEGHSWISIKDKAKKLHLSRPNIRKFTLKKLIDNNLINCYWWGLIMSDGHISNKGDLKIHLQKSDDNYLKKLSDYLEVSLKYHKNLCVLDPMDKINGVFLKEKLNIKSRKTYNPPSDLNFLKSKEEKLAFLIGFIDGDGSIQYRRGSFQSIRIVIHENWFETLQDISNQLKKDWDINSTITKNARGNACMYIGSYNTYKFFLDFIKENNLPNMIRKWRNYDNEN